MKIRGWIRFGDKAACGGTVIEASAAEISNGRGYAFQGARMACRKKGCVIAEGYPLSTLSNGRCQVLHGMVTSNNCPLESTLNDIDGIGNGGGEEIHAAFVPDRDGGWTHSLTHNSSGID
jgi:uncharacterized Zn-binding protein involved in type VI secretion